jgi:hypothetical protein
MSVEPEVKPNDFAFAYLDVDFPPVAWLVYRGLLNSCDVAAANPGNLSWFLLDRIKHGLISTIRREGALEGFRLKDFPSSASRLNCLYAYPTLEMAQRGNYGIEKFSEDNLVAIAPAVQDFQREEHDQEWVTNFDSLPIDTARRYWAGELTAKPMTELLLRGRFFILGTKVRKRAYEIIKALNPNSLAMLELSRLAVEFGSDLGSVAPWLRLEGDRVVVTHIVRYDEAEGLKVFARALEEKKRNTNFQINWDDIKPLCKAGNDPELDAKFARPDFLPWDHLLRLDKVAQLKGFVDQVLHANDPAASVQLNSKEH